MKKSKIKYKDKELIIAPTIKSMIVFEKIMEKPFSVKSVSDTICWLYSMIYVNNNDVDITIEDLMNYSDENEGWINDCLSKINRDSLSN